MNTYMSRCLLHVTLLELAGINSFFFPTETGFCQTEKALQTQKREIKNDWEFYWSPLPHIFNLLHTFFIKNTFFAPYSCNHIQSGGISRACYMPCLLYLACMKPYMKQQIKFIWLGKSLFPLAHYSYICIRFALLIVTYYEKAGVKYGLRGWSWIADDVWSWLLR